MEAPRIIGILKRKMNILQKFHDSKPENKPAAIVHPERENPGKTANP